jgi:hypothetical protein
MKANVDAGLMSLFGRWTFATAQVKRLDQPNVDVTAIKWAAQRVIAERGSLEHQRAIVDEMDAGTAVALCI